jgi:hypothetical protein
MLGKEGEYRLAMQINDNDDSTRNDCRFGEYVCSGSLLKALALF